MRAEVEATGNGSVKAGSGIMSKVQDTAAISIDALIEAIRQHNHDEVLEDFVRRRRGYRDAGRICSRLRS